MKPKKNKMNLKSKCKRIKVVLTDVDGVLTDGGMYYSHKGDVLKRFHVRDGMGVTLLRRNSIQTIIVTKEKNQIIRQWAKKMKIRVFDGVLTKEKILQKITTQLQVKNEEIAYIGDDVNDIGLLKIVGLSAVPSDGIKKVKEICDFICEKNGGHGAFREMVDLILKTKLNKDLEY